MMGFEGAAWVRTTQLNWRISLFDSMGWWIGLTLRWRERLWDWQLHRAPATNRWEVWRMAK